MMLDPDERNVLTLRPICRIFRGQVIRVQVAGDRPGVNVKQALKMCDLTAIGIEGLHVFEVSDVLT